MNNKINISDLSSNEAWAYRKISTIFGVVICCLVFSPYVYASFGFVGLFPLIIILGAYINKITFIMHDCAHNTLFNCNKKNKFWGTLCSYFLGNDFLIFRKSHWLHHQTYGEPNDPQGDDYLGLKNKSSIYIILFILRPLIGWNIYKLFLFNKINQPSKKKSVYKVMKRIGITGVIQFLIALLASNFLREPQLFFLYPLIAVTFSLFFSQLRGLIEHISPHASEKFVRTHLPNFFDGLLLYDLNFNYHVEHHLYPSVPSYHLPSLSKQIIYVHSVASDSSVSNNSFETIFLIFKNKIREKYENSYR